MRHYTAKTLEFTKQGWTDLWIIPLADWVKNATTAQVLTGLAAGDMVRGVLLDPRTAVAGPTATVSVGVVGALTQFTGAIDVTAAVTGTVTAGTATPYVATTTVNMVANEILSNVTVTAGEVWVWANISRLADRTLTDA